MLSRYSLLTNLIVSAILISCDLKVQNATKTIINQPPIQLTFSAWSKSDPAWSPDGSMIAYSHYGQVADLKKISLNEEDLGTIKRVEDDFKNTKFALSPDGTKIVYHSNLKKHLWILNIQDGSQIMLTPEQHDAIDPAWSPDGEWIAFSALNEAKGTNSIWKIPAAGGRAVEITQAEKGDSTPCWSPDGRKIAFQTRRSKTIAIQIIDIESGESQQITSDSTLNYNPDWSPDGSKIAYYSTRNDTTAIWIKPVSGGVETKLTKDIRYAQNPVWSPDGSKIAYLALGGIWVSTTDGEILHQVNIQTRYPVWLPESNGFIAPEIFDFSIIEVFSLIDSSISPATKVVAFQSDTHPSWYPDNNTIAFTRKIREPYSSTIWTTQISDSEEIPLTGYSENYGNEFNPAISPDGNWLLFNDNSSIFLVSALGGEPVDLSPYTGNDLEKPAWAPDGKKFICSTKYRNGSNILKIISADSSLMVEEKVIANNYINPSWSASHPVFGAHIAVERLNKVRSIYIMSPDGSNQELVITRGSEPTWSPDGTKLAFINNRQLYLIPIFIAFQN